MPPAVDSAAPVKSGSSGASLLTRPPEVVHWLVANGLCSESQLIEEQVTVSDVSRRNLNVKVALREGSGYFLKHSTQGARSAHREAAFYERRTPSRLTRAAAGGNRNSVVAHKKDRCCRHRLNWRAPRNLQRFRLDFRLCEPALYLSVSRVDAATTTSRRARHSVETSGRRIPLRCLQKRLQKLRSRSEPAKKRPRFQGLSQ